ncbi:hypothetical protein M3626_20985 [Psychrobacillus sp. MER TA 17]|nr:hypothetical protein [Psychrobacillus sp. MER TA 17]
MRDLEEKYISQFIKKESEMPEVEARKYLEAARESDSEYRVRRINNLTNYLKKFERDREFELEWREAAMEYIELTKKWESLGAFYVPAEYYRNGEYIFSTRPDTGKSNYRLTRWFYNNICFYEWESGSLITQTIDKAREADKKLMELIKKERR